MPKISKVQDGAVFHFSLRWSVPHNPENLAILTDFLRNHADKWVFQAEYTPDNPHYQAYYHTKDRQRPKAMARAQNATMSGINIQHASTNGIDVLKSYCMKSLSRVEGPWADKKIYLGKDLWPLERMPIWQRELLDKLSVPPNDRTMYWIFDPKGNNGKTKFLKTLVYRHDAVGLGYGNSVDVLNLVSKFPGKSTYCWNLTRAKPANLSELDLYSAMESVKDGFFINLKYETTQVLMDPPHVVVLANHLPKFHHISPDRWEVYHIVESRLVRISIK